MADEQVYEPFSMDNDYEGAQYIGGVFVHEGEKKKRRMTKEEAIYGSLLEVDDSDDEGSRRRRGGGGARGKHSSKPINLSSAPRFVSGGTFGPGSETAKNDANEDEDDDTDRPSMMRAREQDEDDDDPAMRNLDSGLQFRRTLQRQQEERQRQRGFGAQSLPTSFGRSGRQQQQQDQQRPRAPTAAAPRAATPKGDWEKYTKGIGSKLLGKMLSKDPEKARVGKLIEVVPLDHHQGIGFGDFSAKTAKARAIANEWSTKAYGMSKKKGDEGDEEPPMDDATMQENAIDDSWRKDFKRAQPKVVYKTADEVAAESGRKEMIIDMTGKEARVLSSMDEAPKATTSTASRRGRPPTFMHEFEHNIRALQSLSEAAQQNVERKIQQEKDAETRATKEIERLDAVLQAEAKQIERLEELNRIVSSCRSRARAVGDEAMNAPELASIFDGLFTKFREEYIVFDLSSTLYTLVAPKVKAQLDSWSLLASPTAPIALFTTLRDAFTRPQKEMRSVTGVKTPAPDNFLRLVVEHLLPRARSTLSTQWSPRFPDPVTQFFEAWKNLLPTSVRMTLLEQCVMPRLQREVDEWNPRQDAVPVHTWLHPWLPLLGDRMEPLYTPLRHKLFKALEAWHPSDPSAHAILLPWRGVWAGAPLERLLNNAIVPKLSLLLSHFVINPSHQELEPFQWLMLWEDLLPTSMLVTLLEQQFFPKWFAVLHAWLRGTPNFEEVSRWYTGWKKLFSPALQSNPRLKVQFSIGLDMMNRAVSGEALPPIPTPPPLPGAAPTSRQQQATPTPPPTPQAHELSFKEVMQRFAEKNGVIFMLSSKRRHPAGKPVYSFGSVDVVLDNDVIFAYIGGQWLPTSLDQLAELAAQQ